MLAPDLYAISDRLNSSTSLVAAAEIAFAAGLGWLQVREKDLPPHELFERGSAVTAVARRYQARVLVNDRSDIALAAGAAGVHLAESRLDLGAVRAAYPTLLIGASVHSLERAREAAAAGADFVLFGPVFATPAKLLLGEPQGLERLREVANGSGVPVVAVGGIGPPEVAACRQAGAAGVAAIRGLLGAPDIAAAVADYRAQLLAVSGAQNR